jgi:acyl carrier protein
MTQTYRLTANQWGMLFLDQVLPSSPLYHVMWTCPVDGPLDVDVLRTAIRAVAARHDALRTRFDLSGIASGAGGRQLVDDEVDVDFAVLATSAAPDDLSPLADLISEPAFDLTTGPLFRLRVLRYAPDRHRLVGNFHHLIFDGWSVGVFLGDLAAAYAGLARGGSGRLAPLPLAYGDYVELQAEGLPEVVERQLPYWRRQLAGLPPVAALPLDRPRPPAQSFRGAEVERPLSEALREEVAGAARRARVTPFIFTLAAFTAQQAAYAGGGDVVVGCPMGARTHPAARHMIGYFINMTVLRTSVPADTTLGGVLGRVRDTVYDALANQEVPFDAVVSDLRPARSLAYNPMFQVLFSFEEADVADIDLGAARIGEVRGLPTYAAKFDLTVTVRYAPGDFTVNLEYATDLFDASTAGTIAEDYERVLRALLADSATTVGDLPVVARARPLVRAPEPVNAVSTAPYTAPRTALEAEILAIWSEVLDLAGLGVEDDFFGLGGDSLSASRVIARVTDRFAVDISVRAMFEAPTVAGLAAHVSEQLTAARPTVPMPAVTPRPRVKLSDLVSNSRSEATP